MADFRLSVDLDTKGILSGLRDVETQARAAGERAGNSLRQALATQARQGVTELTAQLTQLQTRTIRVNVDSSAFQQAGARVEELQRLVNDLNRRNVVIGVDQRSIQGVQQAQRGISDLIAQLAQLQARQVRLQVDTAAYDRLGVRINELQGEIQRLGRERLSVNTDPKSLEVMRQRVADLTGALNKVAVGSPAFQALQRDVAAASAELTQAEKAAGLAQRGFGGLLQTLAGFGAGAAVLGFFKAAIGEASNLESVARRLSNTLGPAGAAGALEFTRQLSGDLGLSFKTLSSGFASFTAAATAANVPIEQQKGLFAAVSKAAQSLGMSNDEISGSLLALRQIASKGTVSMEELRGQLGERMPIALAAAAKGLGLTQRELIKLVESGRLSASEFFPALTKGLNELTSGSGGTRTAAQRFQDLQNAWTNLQTAFGQTVLPAVVGVVGSLSSALNGATSNLKTLVQVAVGLGTFAGAFWLITTAVTAYQKAQRLATAAAIFFQAVTRPTNLIAIAGAIGLASIAVAKVGEEMDKAAKAADENNQQLNKTKQETNAAEAAAKAYNDQIKQAEEARQKELAAANKVTESVSNLATAQGRYAAQIAEAAIQQQDAVLAYGRAAQGVEQSRFDIAKAFNQYELGRLQERGAGEAALRNKRREGEAIELAALQARIRNQTESQRIELQTLAYKQAAARLDADLAAMTARYELMKKQGELKSAEIKGDQQGIELARVGVTIADLGVKSADAKLAILGRMQPLEQQTVVATQQAARNQLAAEAAAKGYGVAIDGTLKKISGTVGRFETLATVTATTADEQGRLAKLAERTGLQARIAADGTVEIGQVLKGVRTPANALAGSFTKVGDAAPTAAQGARDFAAYLSKGKGFADGVAKAGVDTATATAARQAGGLATEMEAAAKASQRFYEYLRQAAGLPAARFSGGPVAPGQTYRVNDGPGGRSLGQESFLSSSGKLSLINRPANSLWAAPSRGLVIPAAVTDQLKERGAFGPSKAIAAVIPRDPGADPATAALAVEVSKLRAEVGELKRKRWDVHVNLCQDGSGLRMQKLLNGMR